LAAVLSLFGTSAFAQFQMNELLLDPAGTDDTWKFLEIKGTPGASLNGYKFLTIEGDGGAAGTIDQAVDLSGYSIGSNGLLLIRASDLVIDVDLATPGIQGPSAGTNVSVFNFTPDMENGSNTFVITKDSSLVVGNDVDADNDGIVDDLSVPGSISDVIGSSEGDSTAANNKTYDLGFSGVVYLPWEVTSAAGFTPDAIVRGMNDSIFFMDLFGDASGDYTLGLQFDIFDTTPEFLSYSNYRGVHPHGTFRDEDFETFANSGLNGMPGWFANLSPGAANPVPEPASVIGLSVALLALARKRKKS
jgi:hypothetical protein